MTEYTRPSTWRPYRKNLCDDCHGDCCRLPVEVHLSELESMGLAYENEIELDLKNLLKRLKKEGIYRLYDQKTGTLTLSQQRDDSCLYLDKNRRCSIYERRPQTCRNFPKIGPRSNFCPYNKNKRC